MAPLERTSGTTKQMLTLKHKGIKSGQFSSISFVREKLSILNQKKITF